MRVVYRAVAFTIALLVAATAGALRAQQATTTGVLRGVVRGLDGEPLVGAFVTAIAVETGMRRGVRTDDMGRYQIPFLYPGPYVLRVRRLGYSPADIRDLSVTVGGIEQRDIGLEPVGMVLEPIRISAASVSQIDKHKIGVSTRVDQRRIARLPTNGRNFKDLVVLAPGVTDAPIAGGGGSQSIGGGRNAASNFLMDGVNNNQEFFGGDMRGGDRLPFSFSIEAIKEIQVVVVGYDVERGNFTGGTVNSVTKSGTNALSGAVFDYTRRTDLGGLRLMADDFNGNKPVEFSSQQYGFAFGGPIVKDRAHFFLSLDRQTRREPRPVFDASAGAFATGSPAFRFARDTLNVILRVALDSLGYDLGREIGAFHLESNETALFGRADWQLNDRHTLTIRDNFISFTQLNDLVNTTPSGPGDFLSSGGRYTTIANSAVASLASAFGNGVTNELRIQAAFEDKPRGANPAGQFGRAVPQVAIRNIGSAGRTNTTDVLFGSDPPLHANHLASQTFEMIDNVRYTRGPHTIKVGASVNGSHVRNDFFFNSLGTFTYPSLAAFRQNQPSSFTRALAATDANGLARAPPIADFMAWDGAAYVQDEWQITPNLFAEFGLRHDITYYESNAPTNPALALAFPHLTASPAPTDGNNLAPRVGFTYDPLGDGRHILRAGTGLFYGRAPLVLMSNVQLSTGLNQLSLMCTAVGTVPRPDFALYGADPSHIPTTCVGGGAASAGRPTVNVFSGDFQQASAWKSNVGYDYQFNTDWRAGVEVVHSRIRGNYLVTDENLRAAPTFLADGRIPVFVDPSTINPANGAASRNDSRVTRAFDQVLLLNSRGRATSLQAIASLGGTISRANFTASYVYDRTRDNGSRSCCMAGPDFFDGATTVGDPNNLTMREGPADYNRVHSVLLSSLLDLPKGIEVAGIYRGFSGRPFTPLYQTDVNGDGAANDRIFVPTDAEIGTMSLAAVTAGADPQTTARALSDLINSRSCLRAARGTFVSRNACRNPWQHVVDIRASKAFDNVLGQRVVVVADGFNVLNGLNPRWGRRLEVNSSDEKLLAPVAFDPQTKRYSYRVNTNFARATPTQFTLNQQFQLQLGVRYEF